MTWPWPGERIWSSKSVDISTTFTVTQLSSTAGSVVDPLVRSSTKAIERHLFRIAALLCLSSSVLRMASIESIGMQLWHFLIFLAFSSCSRKEVGSTWFNDAMKLEMPIKRQVMKQDKTSLWPWLRCSGLQAQRDPVFLMSRLSFGPPLEIYANWINTGNPIRSSKMAPWCFGSNGVPMKKSSHAPSLAKRQEGTADGKCLQQRMNPSHTNLRRSSKLEANNKTKNLDCFESGNPLPKSTFYWSPFNSGKLWFSG